MTITEPGLYEMTNADYHADPVPDGSLSVVAAKRKDTTDPADQWVVMTLEEFVAILNGSRDHTDEHRKDTP